MEKKRVKRGGAAISSTCLKEKWHYKVFKVSGTAQKKKTRESVYRGKHRENTQDKVHTLKAQLLRKNIKIPVEGEERAGGYTQIRLKKKEVLGGPLVEAQRDPTLGAHLIKKVWKFAAKKVRTFSGGLKNSRIAKWKRKKIYYKQNRVRGL